ASRAEPLLTGPEQLRAIATLDRGWTDLRAAAAWAIADGQSELALRLAGALTMYLRIRCLFSEGAHLCRHALDVPGPEAAGLRAAALWGLGFMSVMLGDNDGARMVLDAGLVLARATSDRRAEARALLLCANVAHNTTPDSPEALELYERSARLAEE